MATLPELLKTTVEMNGSDLHISTNTPPQVRVHGHLQRLAMSELTPSETKQLVYSVLTDSQKKRFEETLELDFSFGIKGLARFRCNVFNQRGAVTAVYRLIPETIRAFGELGLPPVLATLAENPVDKEVHDDALYLLAWCQMDTQAWNDAKNTWRTLIRRFPESRFTGEAKLQLGQLQLTH